jgi:hypothetical protein
MLLQALRESSEAAAVEELKEMSDVSHETRTLETRCSSASSATCGIARKSSFSGGFYLSHQPAIASEIMKYQWPDQNSQSK